MINQSANEILEEYTYDDNMRIDTYIQVGRAKPSIHMMQMTEYNAHTKCVLVVFEVESGTYVILNDPALGSARV